MDDTWFDLVPLALLEFNEHGRVLRGNSALSALLGYATPAGSNLSDSPQALQRLCGWDAPLTLLAHGPEDAPLQAQVTQARMQGRPALLRSQVWAQAQTQADHPRRFLCAIRDSVLDDDHDGTASPGIGISSDADAAAVGAGRKIGGTRAGRATGAPPDCGDWCPPGDPPATPRRGLSPRR